MRKLYPIPQRERLKKKDKNSVFILCNIGWTRLVFSILRIKVELKWEKTGSFCYTQVCGRCWRVFWQHSFAYLLARRMFTINITQTDGRTEFRIQCWSRICIITYLCESQTFWQTEYTPYPAVMGIKKRRRKTLLNR